MSKLDFRTAVVQMKPVPGDVWTNAKAMAAHIEKAKSLGAQLVVFPELCVTGYLLGDRWEHESFIRDIEAANNYLRTCSKGLVVVWGSIRADFHRIGEDGRVRKYNAALIAQDGAWVSNGALTGWIPKTNLPKYRMFDDARHFYPAAKLAEEMGLELPQLLHPFRVGLGVGEVSLALAICEDLWEDEYNTKPSRIYGAQSPDLLIDISSSPWTAEKWHARDEMLRKRAHDAGCPILYVNVVGLQNNAKNLVWFDGGNCLVAPDGTKRWMELNHDYEAMSVIVPAQELLHEPMRWQPSAIEEIETMTVAAMREFLAPFPKVVIGLSGGIDSAVSLALMVKAIGAKRLLAINMPTQFNSKTTKDLAARCAENLGVEYRISSIQAVYEAELAADGTLREQAPMLVKENIQARARGSRLAHIAAEVGGVFTCNGNKTEVALNYFTLYGDGAGACAFLGDLWKGQVYELARLINERAGRDIIPQGIIDIVPSAELSAEQNVDEGKGDPIFYPYHDHLLRAFIERRVDPEMVLDKLLEGTLEKELGCAPGTIEKYFKSTDDLVRNLEWAWRQYSLEFKRHQLPPVLIASRRAFGFDRRETMAPAFTTERYRVLKDRCLKKEAA